jgi:hypothetical protein
MELCQIFAEHIELSLSFTKFMELCEVLPKLWKYVQFGQKYGVMSTFAKKIEFFLSFAQGLGFRV